MRLLFVHGAGGQVEDRALADALGAAVAAEVDMPLLPDDDMSYEGWAVPVRQALARAGRGDLVVGHSFGASVLLRVLGEEGTVLPSRAVLLAMPDWTPDGWDVADYAFLAPEPAVPLSLHHCRDDEIVPHVHLELHARRLPSAATHLHGRGGHQFEGLSGVIARDLTDGVGPVPSADPTGSGSRGEAGP